MMLASISPIKQQTYTDLFYGFFAAPLNKLAPESLNESYIILMLIFSVDRFS